MATTHDHDPKRSTFQLQYPITPKTCTRTSDFRLPNGNLECKSKIVTFSIQRKYIEDVKFFICQFFVVGPDVEILKLSFRNCSFSQCFIGSVTFKECRFESCQFSECDFSNSRFSECIFQDCTFSSITAFHTSFISSEIDADRFLSNFIFHENNYRRNAATLVEIAHARREFKKAKFNLSKVIYNSNTESGNFQLSDVSLFQLKRYELQILIDIFRHSSPHSQSPKEKIVTCLWNRPHVLARIIKENANIFATKGGTSYKRLFIIAVGIVLVFNFYLAYSGIDYENFKCTDEPSTLMGKYLYWLPKSLTIFFSFGYGGVVTHTIFQQWIAAIYGLLGAFWYAILIPILFRRIYK